VKKDVNDFLQRSSPQMMRDLREDADRTSSTSSRIEIGFQGAHGFSVCVNNSKVTTNCRRSWILRNSAGGQPSTSSEQYATSVLEIPRWTPTLVFLGSLKAKSRKKTSLSGAQHDKCISRSRKASWLHEFSSSGVSFPISASLWKIEFG